MDLNSLSELGKIAGIAGIAIGALVLIFSSVIRKNIFPGLTKDQGYKVIRLILFFAGTLALVGVGAWVYLDVVKNAREKENRLSTRYIVGNVVDEEGRPVISANIEISQDNSFLDKSDRNGHFALEVKGVGSTYLDVVVKHKSYITNRQKVKIDFESDETEVNLNDPIVMVDAFPPDQEDVSQNGQNRNSSAANEDAGNYTPPRESNVQTNTGSAIITIKYMGDALNCQLDLNISIGGMVFTPNSNPFRVSNIPSGVRDYSINGNIYCSTGSCQATGAGSVYIQNNGQYYIMWNYNTCEVGIYSQQDYNRLNGL